MKPQASSIRFAVAMLILMISFVANIPQVQAFGRARCDIQLAEAPNASGQYLGEASTVNNYAEYRVRFFPDSTRSDQTALKLIFPKSSGIRISNPTPCTALDRSVFTSATPNCTPGEEPDGSPSVIVGNLISRRIAYNVGVSNVVNAPAAYEDVVVQCMTCLDEGCSTYLDQAEAELTFTVAALPPERIKLKLSDNTNGARASTLLFTIQHGASIIPGGAVVIGLPPVNANYYRRLGSWSEEDLITDAGSLLVTVATAQQDAEESEETSLGSVEVKPIGKAEFPDTYATLKIHLNNVDTIPGLINGRQQELRVRVFPVTNPPSMKAVTGFVVYTALAPTGRANYYIGIEACQSGIVVQTTAPGVMLTTQPTLSKAEFVDAKKAMVESTDVAYRFTLYTTNAVPQRARIYIDFPEKWNLECFPMKYSVKCISQTCSMEDPSYPLYDSNEPSRFIKCKQDINRLEFWNGFEQDYHFRIAPGPIVFEVGGFTNPAATEQVRFTVTTVSFDTDLYLIDRSDQFTLKFETGTLTVTSVVPTDKVIFSPFGSYKIKFKAQHKIRPDYMLEITWPKEFAVLQSSDCKVKGEAADLPIPSDYSCAADAADRQITIKKFVRIETDGEITLQVDSIQNPGNYEIPGVIKFMLRNGEEGPIDSGQFQMKSSPYNASYVESFQVIALDKTAGQDPVSYAFSVRPHASVVRGSYLVVDLPPEVTVADLSGLTRGCRDQNKQYWKGFSNKYISCSYQQSRNSIIVKNGFLFKPSNTPPNGKLNLSWQVPYLRNPRSLAPTGMFNVTIFDDKDRPLYYFNTTSGPIVRMKNYKPPESISYTRTSAANGQLGNYTWQVKPSNYIEEGDRLSFTMPDPIQFTEATRAFGTSYWLDGELERILSDDLSKIEIVVRVSTRRRRQLALEQSRASNVTAEEGHSPRASPAGRRSLQSIPSGAIINLMLTDVTSPSSLRPAKGSVKYAVYTKAGDTVEASKAGLEIVNEEVGKLKLQQAGVTPSYWEKKQEANYTVAFKPANFEQRMKIKVTVPKTITVPEKVKCHGVLGIDDTLVNCEVDIDENTITLTNATDDRDMIPPRIEFMIESLYNPKENIVTESFGIETYTYDGYGIDEIKEGLLVNFYCVYPCKTCNLTEPTQCLSCYTATTEFIYLHEDRCIDGCPEGMYAVMDPDPRVEDEAPECKACEWPCTTCSYQPHICDTCALGYELYEVNRTCYEEISYPWPFISAAVLIFILVLIVDCCRRSTNLLHSVLYFYSFLECACWGYMLYLYSTGEVEGNRTLTAASLASHVVLNLLFIVVHCKLMMGTASPEYKQVFKEFKCSSWFIQILAYLLNFKMSIMLVSSFAARPRFSGTFNSDSWMKFNIFAILYIVLVYTTFTVDFYVYFTTYKLRKLSSHVAIEAAVIMSVICLILLLEILSQCSCAGIGAQDLGKRAGLFKDLKGQGKKKRRVKRSGMGNVEGDYGDYDSEEEYDSELEQAASPAEEEESEEEEYDEEEEQSEEYDEEEEEEESDIEDSRQEVLKKRKAAQMDEENKAQLDMLETLAQQMRDEKDALNAEKKQVLDEKLRLLQEKERYLTEQGHFKEGFDQEKQTLRAELDAVKDGIDEKIEQRIAEQEAERALARITAGGPTVQLPSAVHSEIAYSISVGGDEEYWLQNVTPSAGYVSDKSAIIERDASVVEYFMNEDAINSNVFGARELEDEQEMRANISAGPVRDNDLSLIKSMHATEENFLEREEAVFGEDDGKLEKQATQQEFFDGASAVFSNIDGQRMSRHATEEDFVNKSNAEFMMTDGPGREREGAEIEQLEQRSAEFGDIAGLLQDGSQQDFLNKSDAAFGRESLVRERDGEAREEVLAATPHVDVEGRSSESSEGIVADHAPFSGVQDAIANQDQLREGRVDPTASEEEEVRDPTTVKEESKYIEEPAQSEEKKPSERPMGLAGLAQDADIVGGSEDDSADDDDNRPSARRRIKQVLYSDKSESSVDDMMEDTPSNYNIANGRLEGKSMGLKAILLFAKNQGVNLGPNADKALADGNRGQLPQIQEEAQQTPNNGLNRTSAMQSSGEGRAWRAMNQPLGAGRGAPVVGQEDMPPVGRTLEHDASGPSKGGRSRRNPGAKQFREPAERVDLTDRGNQDLKNIKKNNFV